MTDDIVTRPFAALIRCEDNPQHTYYIYGDETKIGRSEQALITLFDTSVSRKHCIIERKSDNSFTICDTSVHGTFVNGKQLKKNKAVELHHNDLLSIPPKFRFKFKINISAHFSQAMEDETENLNSQLKEKRLTLDNCQLEEMKRLNEEIQQIKAEKADIEKSMNLKLEAQENIFSNERNSMSTLITSTKEKKCEAEKRLHDMGQTFNAEKEKLLLEIKVKINDVNKKEKELQQSRDEMELRHQKERRELEQRCKKEVEDLKFRLAEFEVEQGRQQGEYLEKEQRLLRGLEETKQTLMDCEKEQNRLYEEKMEVEKTLGSKIVDLTNASSSKDEIVKDLENKLKEKEEEEKQRKKEIEGLEEHLQCSICVELFIDPIVLNCGHMYCSMCIQEWQTKKKVCPMCRTNIFKSMRIYHLDAIIEKNVALLSAEAKTRRDNMVQERQKSKNKVVPKKRKHGGYVPVPPVTLVPYTEFVDMAQVQLLERLNNTPPILVDDFAWHESGRLRTRSSRVFHDPTQALVGPNSVAVAAIDLTQIATPVLAPVSQTPTATSSNRTIDLTSP